jgi:molecular chaperone GrpE (heat shock protein)
MSNEMSVPRAAKWPFLLGDAVLVGCAYFIFWQARLPFGPWELAGVVACVALGAWLAVWPFLNEYQACLRLAESQGLNETVAQIQKLETVAAQIATATAQWQGVQDGCTRAVSAVGELRQRMELAGKESMEFLKKANDSERAALRLETEKLRRAEGDWLQVLVRIVDHVLALHGAAVRSGQPQLAKQITHFRDSILETTRRVGFLPFGAAPGQPFDPEAHQRIEEKAETLPDAKIAETLAPGYTFQGQPIRRALVRLEGEALPEPPAAPTPTPREELQATPTAPDAAPGEAQEKPGELF